MTDNPFRALPAVDTLLTAPTGAALSARYGRTVTVEALRTVLDQARAALRSGASPATAADSLLDRAAVALYRQFAPSLRPVINATGIIIHTNLGRAPLSDAAQAALIGVAAGYSTLEYDLAAGQRGSRLTHPESALTALTGAEAALVVNNNAAAVLLMLSALAKDRDVLISRGQLIEIGGGFRIPDVLAQSGARLVEVGATNKTRLSDYERALTPATAAILHAHASNFKQIGFVEVTPLEELASLGQRRGVLLMDDLGSGALLDTAAYGLDHEPTAQESLAAGADLVCFSGDKLLGGPQAGLLVGRQAIIAQLKQHPLARAVRADKLCLAGLAATLTHYLTENALTEIPIWRMIARPSEEIGEEADTWAARLQERGIRAEVVDGRSTVGGGSLPGTSLASRLVAIQHTNLEHLATRLRQQQVPVIGRIQDGRFLIDPRTILPEQVEILLQSLVNCAAE